MKKKDYPKKSWVSYNNPCIKCGSSDAVAIDSIGAAYCFSCQTHFKEYDEMPLATKPNKVIDKKDISIDDILELPIIELTDRCISKAAAEHYGVRTSFNTETGEPEYRYFPYYQGEHLCFKRKKIGDKSNQLFIGNTKNEPFNLFGKEKVLGTNFIIICEGEEDTLAAYDLLAKSKKQYNVVSLPNGANIRHLQDNLKWLYEFTCITLAFDNDEPGKKCAEKAAKLFDPGQCKVAKFKDYKDSNDYLVAGKYKDWLSCIYNATVMKPDGIVTISDIWEEATRKPEWGLPWPWEKLTNATYGRRRGEIYGIGAGTGVGKSEFFKEVVDRVINIDGLPIGCAFLEEPAPMSAKRIAGKRVNKLFHIPDSDYEQEELESSLRLLDNRLWLYNHNGQKDWDAIKQYFKFLARSIGVKDFILDNLTAVVAQEENEYHALNAIMEEMASLSSELDCNIYYASHLRKATGTPHEEGGRVQLTEFKGSGAMGNWSNFIFALERDTQAPDPVVKNTTTFRVLKDRYTGLSTGYTFDLWYDHNTGMWREKTDEDNGILY